MSRFDLDYQTGTHVPPADHHGAPFFSAQRDRDNERGSLSGSDDGTYAPYSDALKAETDTEDDSSALTSQTLNADGTPKRPMNAFMIFARRRRPQVSSENQAMRTGEISKILSKEWNSMQATEKQFYQDQAKQLKDTFNTRYPDYVYRRRPNNSRKRRKPDGSGGRPVDNPLPNDTGDDLTGFGDMGESPTDIEDTSVLDVSPDLHRSRLSHDVHRGYGDQGKFGPASSSRASPYAYAMSDHSFRSNDTHEGRLSHPPSSDRVPSSPSLTSPHVPYQYTLPTQSRPHSHSQSNPLYVDYLGGQNTWDPAAVRPGTFVGGDRSRTSHLNQKSHSYSSSATQPSWQHSPTGIGAPSTSLTPPNFLLPTLNSPLRPPESHLQDASPVHPHPISQSPFTHNHMQPGSLPREYDSNGYSASPSTSPTNTYSSNGERDGALYAQRHPGFKIRGGVSMLSYPQSLPPQPPPGSGPGAHQGYWARD